eukprot:2859532-Rhodomonas_salina.1
MTRLSRVSDRGRARPMIQDFVLFRHALKSAGLASRVKRAGVYSTRQRRSGFACCLCLIPSTELIEMSLARLYTWVEASPFMPVSMLRGGISTAIAANVPTEICDLQSGHKSDERKEYAELADKALLWVGGGCISYTLRMPQSIQLLSGGVALSGGHVMVT